MDLSISENSNSLWILIRENESKGGVIRYNDKIRIKHIATGKYLTIKEPSHTKKPTKRKDSAEKPNSGAPHNESGQNYELDTLADRTDRTVFTLHPMTSHRRVNENSKIKVNSYFFIRHVATGNWIYVNQKGAFKTKLRAPVEGNDFFLHKNQSLFGEATTTSEQNDNLIHQQDDNTSNQLQVYGNNKLSGDDEDLFTFISATRTSIDNLYYTNSQVKIILEFIHFLENKGREKINLLQSSQILNLRAQDEFLNRSGGSTSSASSSNDRLFNQLQQSTQLSKKLMDVLSNMIISCTISSEINPLKREGIPIKCKQNLYREQNVLESLQKLLREIFQHVTLEELITKPEYFTMKQICRLSYRLLKLLIKSNAVNQAVISSSDWIRFMEDQISLPEAISALMELFRDNKNLLDEMTVEQICYFCIYLLKENGMESNFIKFLSILCVCKNNALPQNQVLIATKLIVENPELLISMKKQDNQVYAKTPSSSSRTSASEWVTIDEFVNDQSSKVVDYLIDSINLLSSLIKGRNQKTLHLISNVMKYDLLLISIKNHHLPNNLRTAFAELLLVLYIDIHPFEICNFTTYTRIWSHVLTDFHGHPPSIHHEAGHSPLITPSPSPSMHLFDELIEFIKEFIISNQVQIIDDQTLNLFILSLIKILHKLFSFGFYNLECIDTLIEHLIGLLDGRTDKMHATTTSNLPPANPPVLVGTSVNLAVQSSMKQQIAGSRYTKNDKTVIVMEIKYIICLILNIICDIRLNQRLNELLIMFKNEIMKYEKEGGSIREDKLFTLRLSKDNSGEVDALFKKYTFGKDKKLIEILTDLVLYEYSKLSTIANHLLIRNFSQKEEIKKSVLITQLLVSDESAKTYEIALHQLEILKTWRNEPIDKIIQCIDHLSKLTILADVGEEQEDSGKANASQSDAGKGEKMTYIKPHQRILHNLHGHLIIIEILNYSINQHKSMHEYGIFELYKTAFTFLKHFCGENTENQNSLFPYFHIFLKFLTKNVGASYFILELVKENYNIATQISENQIRSIVSAISDAGCKYPHFIEILECLCILKKQKKTIRKNQNLVLKLILEKQGDTLLLFNNHSDIQKRNQLILEKDHVVHKEGLLNYHMKLIDLISKCAKGKIYEAEIKCQSIFSLNDVIRQLIDPDNLHEIKMNFLNFLFEVYFETERKLQNVENNPSLVKLFSSFIQEIYHLLNQQHHSHFIKQEMLRKSQEALKKSKKKKKKKSKKEEKPEIAEKIMEIDNIPWKDGKEELNSAEIYVFHYILPFVGYFFQNYLHDNPGVGQLSHNYQVITNKLFDAIKELFVSSHYSSNPQLTHIVGNCLFILVSKNFTGESNSPTIKSEIQNWKLNSQLVLHEQHHHSVSTPNVPFNIVTDSKLSIEDSIIFTFRDFRRSFINSIDFDEELNSLGSLLYPFFSLLSLFSPSFFLFSLPLPSPSFSLFFLFFPFSFFPHLAS